jgi:hypothetical protein
MSFRRGVLVFAFGVVGMAAAPVRAAGLEAPTPVPGPAPAPVVTPAPAPPASEAWLPLVQVGVSAGAMVGAYYLAAAVWGATPIGSVAIMSFAPLLAGQGVCALGQLSARYRGGCGSAIAGAYLGAAAVVPLTFVACLLNGGRETAGTDSVCGFVLGATWFVLAPLAAVIGWNEGKELRPGATADPPAPAVEPPASLQLELGLRRWEGGAPDARRVAVPVLAFRF